VANDAERKEMGRLMDILVRNERRIHYAQIRPMRTMSIKPGRLRLALYRPGGITMDCSESVTLICHLAGLRDPNGLHYSGRGFTGTLLEHLEHYEDPSRARTGALVVFGGGTGEHVCMVRHPHASNPMLFSHGTESGPRFIDLASEKHGFPGEKVTFLAISKL